jgi:hypothetical protein
VQLIYIGDHFYWESGTMMGSMYTSEGVRADFNTVTSALQKGEAVHIRPANATEYGDYERKLRELKDQKSKFQQT